MNKTITTAELIKYLQDAPKTLIEEITHENGNTTAKRFETPLTLKSYIDINFKAWIFYKVIKAGRAYKIYYHNVLKYEYRAIR